MVMGLHDGGRPGRQERDIRKQLLGWIGITATAAGAWGRLGYIRQGVKQRGPWYETIADQETVEGGTHWTNGDLQPYVCATLEGRYPVLQ